MQSVLDDGIVDGWLVGCWLIGCWGELVSAGTAAANSLTPLHQFLRVEHNFAVPSITVSTVRYHAHGDFIKVEQFGGVVFALVE